MEEALILRSAIEQSGNRPSLRQRVLNLHRAECVNRRVDANTRVVRCREADCAQANVVDRLVIKREHRRHVCAPRPLRRRHGVSILRIRLVDFLTGEELRRIPQERPAISGVHVGATCVGIPAGVIRALRKRADLVVFAREIEADEQTEFDALIFRYVVEEPTLLPNVPIEPLVDTGQIREVP